MDVQKSFSPIPPAPLAVGKGGIHLSSMVFHFVFMNGNQENVLCDVYFFGIVMLIAILMLLHLEIFNLPRTVSSTISLRKMVTRFTPEINNHSNIE